MLHCCFVVSLQNCFEISEVSPDLLLAGWRVNNPQFWMYFLEYPSPRRLYLSSSDLCFTIKFSVSLQATLLLLLCRLPFSFCFTFVKTLSICVFVLSHSFDFQQKTTTFSSVILNRSFFRSPFIHQYSACTASWCLLSGHQLCKYCMTPAPSFLFSPLTS